MGLDVSVVIQTDLASDDVDYVELYYARGACFFKESEPPISELKQDKDGVKITYWGASHLFEGKIKNGKFYPCKDVIAKIEELRNKIEPMEYKGLMRTLEKHKKEKDVYFIASW